jgi:hypothetical protein
MHGEFVEELKELRRLSLLAREAHQQHDKLRYSSALAEYSARGMNLADRYRQAAVGTLDRPSR